MGHSSQPEKDTMRFFLLASAVVAASLASEDVFLNWAKEQGRQYHTRAELTKRRAIFMKNYNRMVEHNKEFAAGRVSWARGVNQWYDLTEEEWAAELGLGISPVPRAEHDLLTLTTLQWCSTKLVGLEGPQGRLPDQEPEAVRKLCCLRRRRHHRVLLRPEDRGHHRPVRGAPRQLLCHRRLWRLVD